MPKDKKPRKKYSRKEREERRLRRDPNAPQPLHRELERSVGDSDARARFTLWGVRWPSNTSATASPRSAGEHTFPADPHETTDEVEASSPVAGPSRLHAPPQPSSASPYSSTHEASPLASSQPARSLYHDNAAPASEWPRASSASASPVGQSLAPHAPTFHAINSAWPSEALHVASGASSSVPYALSTPATHMQGPARRSPAGILWHSYAESLPPDDPGAYPTGQYDWQSSASPGSYEQWPGNRSIPSLGSPYTHADSASPHVPGVYVSGSHGASSAPPPHPFYSPYAHPVDAHLSGEYASEQYEASVSSAAYVLPPEPPTSASMHLGSNWGGDTSLYPTSGVSSALVLAPPPPADVFGRYSALLASAPVGTDYIGFLSDESLAERPSMDNLDQWLSLVDNTPSAGPGPTQHAGMSPHYGIAPLAPPQHAFRGDLPEYAQELPPPPFEDYDIGNPPAPFSDNGSNYNLLGLQLGTPNAPYTNEPDAPFAGGYQVGPGGGSQVSYSGGAETYQGGRWSR